MQQCKSYETYFMPSCCAADFFLEHGDPERGVQLLIQAGQPGRALDLCHQFSITMTEVSLTTASAVLLTCSTCFCSETGSVYSVLKTHADSIVCGTRGPVPVVQYHHR